MIKMRPFQKRFLFSFVGSLQLIATIFSIVVVAGESSWLVSILFSGSLGAVYSIILFLSAVFLWCIQIKWVVFFYFAEAERFVVLMESVRVMDSLPVCGSD